jgi:hypothetical protein
MSRDVLWPLALAVNPGVEENPDIGFSPTWWTPVHLESNFVFLCCTFGSPRWVCTGLQVAIQDNVNLETKVALQASGESPEQRLKRMLLMKTIIATSSRSPHNSNRPTALTQCHGANTTLS